MAARVVVHYYIPVLHVCVLLRDSVSSRDSVTFWTRKRDSWPPGPGLRKDAKVAILTILTKVTKVQKVRKGRFWSFWRKLRNQGSWRLDLGRN